MQVVIVEMVILGAVEIGERRDLRHDGIVPEPRFGDFLNYFLSRFLLFLIVSENCRAILRSDIRALPISVVGSCTVIRTCNSSS